MELSHGDLRTLSKALGVAVARCDRVLERPQDPYILGVYASDRKMYIALLDRVLTDLHGVSGP